jgi:hypothetical protein
MVRDHIRRAHSRLIGGTCHIIVSGGLRHLQLLLARILFWMVVSDDMNHAWDSAAAPDPILQAADRFAGLRG